MRDKKSQLFTELYEVITHSFLINFSRKFQFFNNILSLYNCLLKICFFFKFLHLVPMTIQTRLHLDKNKNNNNNNNRPGTSSGSCPVSLPWEVGKERALYHSRPLSLLDLILRPPGGSGDENSFVQKKCSFPGPSFRCLREDRETKNDPWNQRHI